MDEVDPNQSEAEVQGNAEPGGEAGGTMEEARRGGWRGLFSFETMYFPAFAHYVFIVFVAVVLLVGLGGVVAAFAAMARVGFSDGMFDLLRTVAMVVFLVVAGRLWIELAMVAFKINEALQDIRQHIKKSR